MLAASPPIVSQVSSGLNLWLQLKDPARMGELLDLVLRAKPRIDEALTALHYVHFARFLPTADWRALQVITSFDGELDAYVLDFVRVLGPEFDAILRYVTLDQPFPPPRGRVQDQPAQFLEFVRRNNLGNSVLFPGDIDLYCAYPQRTVIDIVGTAGMAPAAKPAEPAPVDRSDVQANVLRGVGARHARHVALRIIDPAGARALLGELLTGRNGAPSLSNDATRAPGEAKPACWLTLGFTYPGLLALGISDADQAAFLRSHPVFARGADQVDAAQALGDVGASAPGEWVLGGRNPLDMLLSLYADDAAELDRQGRAVVDRCTAHGLVVVDQRDAQALSDPKFPKERFVHFGYADGLAQPRIAIQGHASRDDDMQPEASVGEFLLGAAYTNVFGGKGSLGGISSELAQNGTFAALRIMRQDVAGFEKLLDEQSSRHKVDREWLAAKLMGRWRDGTPLSQSPDGPMSGPGAPGVNEFDYRPSVDHPATNDDSRGLRCPIGAHVRRNNPRSALVQGIPHTRRLLRRGMPYGPRYDPQSPDGQDRGLVGLFLCADLDRQFEFILRQWVQGDRATSGLVGQQDPIIGAQQSLNPGQAMTGTYRIPRGSGRDELVLDVPRLVTTVGGAYLFMPGLGGVRHLAGLAGGIPGVATSFTAQLRAAQAPATPGAEAPSPPDPGSFDPGDQAFRDDPFAAYAWFRGNTQGIVYLPRVDSTWILSHELVRQVSDDQDLFHKLASTDPTPRGLLHMDPPGHGPCREEIEPMFLEVLAAEKPAIQGIVARCYEANCRNKGTVDWMSAFAQTVARSVFLAMFGLDESQALEAIELTEKVLNEAPVDDRDPMQQQVMFDLAAIGSVLNMKKYLCPPKSLFGRILTGTTAFDPGCYPKAPDIDPLLAEQAVNATTMVLTGILPLQWFMALAIWRLLENDGALLAQIKRDATITNEDVIDELARFDMSPPMSKRYPAQDTSINGYPVKKDQPLMLVWASASRDERIFGVDADRIDFKRATRGPGWAFGSTTNDRNCLGREMVYAVMAPVIDMLRGANPVPALAAGFKPDWGLPRQAVMFRAMRRLDVRS